jgi:hypothetical protein
LIFNILLVSLVGCGINNSFSERDSFVQKLEALKFLSDYHHQLHIMIGEDEGDGDQAYNEFSSAIRKFNNPELIPVVSSFERINRFSIASESVMRLDYLIDYYQSGLSLQIEAILRGHGYLKTFPIDSAVFIYDKLQADS